MKFHEYLSGYDRLKRMTGDVPGTVGDFYEYMVEVARKQDDSFVYRQAVAEQQWTLDKKPYYNVWPAVFPMVRKLTLDLPCSAVKCPLDVLCLRLPVENNPFTFGDGECIRSILVTEQLVTREVGSKDLVRGLVIAVDAGEIDRATGLPVFTFKIFPLNDDQNVETASELLSIHESWYQGQQIPAEIMQQVVKLSCCVCLIGDDPDLITEDVLAKDRADFRDAGEERRKVIIDRARRRGKYGFDLGGKLEVDPHYRRPHLAIVLYGKGKSKTKIIMRKGSIVHREKMASVPTGRE